jgi:hypothetical protein
MPPLYTMEKQQRAQSEPNKDRSMRSLSPQMRNSKRVRYPLLIPSPVTRQSRKISVSGRKIAFSGTLQVEEIIHVSEYTQDEVSSTWYDRKEIGSFKEDRKNAAKRIDQGVSSDSDCLRGVESLTVAGARIRYESVLVGINSVLDEQELQDLDGKEDPEMLAHIYRLNTHQSEALAHQRGLSDEREVLKLSSFT